MSEERWPIPSSWHWTTAENVAKIVGGGTPSTKLDGNFAEIGIPWITPADLTGYQVSHISRGRRDLSEQGFATSGAQILPMGSVLFSSRAPIGYCVVASNEVATSQGFKSLVLEGGIDPAYIRHYLLSAKDYAESKASGTTFKELSGTRVAELAVPIAPLPEQRRIVAKVDGLTARTARVRKELDRIPTLIARYKQRLLALAFSGELTADWRRTNLNLDNDRNLGAVAVHSDDNERGVWEWETLPSSWQWVPFRSAFLDVTDSKRKIQTKEYRETGRFPIVDQGMTQVAGYTDREDMAQLAEPPYIIFGDHTRAVKLVRTRFVQGADGVKVLNPTAEFDVVFLYFALQCVRLPAKGYSRHMKFLRATVFPMCSLKEQAEIVRRIESAFGWLDRVAADHAAAARLLPKLDAAILAKAFRGELVPQDPNDEPADILLKRIKAERAATPTPKRGRKAKALVKAGAASLESEGASAIARSIATEKSGMKDMTKNRQDNDVWEKPYLAGLLKQSDDVATAEELFSRSSLGLADFYHQLAIEYENGWLIEVDGHVKAVRL